MDGEPPTVVELKHDDFEEVPGSRWPEKERPTRLAFVVLKGESDKGMSGGVNDVLVCDAVLPSGVVEVHTPRV